MESSPKDDNSNSSPISNKSLVDKGIDLEKAEEDYGLLSEVIANTDGDVTELFVMSLRILNFIEKGEQKETRDCMVC
jgi:hypothetical protein